MSRLRGPLLFVLLLTVLAGTRCYSGARASAMVEHEHTARALMGELLEASLAAVASGRPHPGFSAAFLERFPTLEARPELGTGLISYADDGDYLYALAVVSGVGAGSGGPREGFVLRAWPLDFGSTGDLEYQATEDGRLWEGMNYSGRSGTDFGFPPLFPEPDLSRIDAGWMPLGDAVPAHK